MMKLSDYLKKEVRPATVKFAGPVVAEAIRMAEELEERFAPERVEPLEQLVQQLVDALDEQCYKLEDGSNAHSTTCGLDVYHSACDCPMSSLDAAAKLGFTPTHTPESK